MVKVADLMDSRHPTVPYGSTSGYARATFRETRVRILPVLDGEKLVGVITRIGIMSVTATRSDLTVRDLMITPQLVLKPYEDIFNAAQKLLQVDDWYAPVVDEQNKYLGVYGLEHFMIYMLNQEHPANSEPVKKYMSQNVEFVYVDDPISKVWHKMLEFRYAGFPVITHEGKLIGVVTQIDILKRGFTRLQLESESAPRRGPTVEAVMSTPPITIPPSASIHEAAKIMVDRNIGRLIVVKGGKIEGIIDRSDITRAYLSF